VPGSPSRQNPGEMQARFDALSQRIGEAFTDVPAKRKPR
jgi:hypothetical protein